MHVPKAHLAITRAEGRVETPRDHLTFSSSGTGGISFRVDGACQHPFK